MVPNLYNRKPSDGVSEGADQLDELRNFKTSQKEADGIASAVSVVPVWGQLVAGGMKLGGAIGKRTMNEFGIYKSRAAGVADQTFNPATHIQNFKDITKKTNAKSVTNLLSGGIFGKSATQQIRQKNIDDTKRRIAMETRTNDAKLIQNDQLTATF